MDRNALSALFRTRKQGGLSKQIRSLSDVSASQCTWDGARVEQPKDSECGNHGRRAGEKGRRGGPIRPG